MRMEIIFDILNKPLLINGPAQLTARFCQTHDIHKIIRFLMVRIIVFFPDSSFKWQTSFDFSLSLRWEKCLLLFLLNFFNHKEYMC